MILFIKRKKNCPNLSNIKQTNNTYLSLGELHNIFCVVVGMVVQWSVLWGSGFEPALVGWVCMFSLFHANEEQNRHSSYWNIAENSLALYKELQLWSVCTHVTMNSKRFYGKNMLQQGYKKTPNPFWQSCLYCPSVCSVCCTQFYEMMDERGHIQSNV